MFANRNTIYVSLEPSKMPKKTTFNPTPPKAPKNLIRRTKAVRMGRSNSENKITPDFSILKKPRWEGGVHSRDSLVRQMPGSSAFVPQATSKLPLRVTDMWPFTCTAPQTPPWLRGGAQC